MAGRQKSDEKREGILRAAYEAFAGRDFHQVLMEDVSSRAGVGKGTLYRYFPTKEELFLATVFRGIDEFHAQFLRVFAEDAPVQDILEDAVARVLEYFSGRGEVLALVQRYEHRLPQEDAASWQQRRDEARRAIAEVLERERSRGGLRCSDARLCAEMLLGMVRGAIQASLVRDRDPREVAHDIVSIFLDGARVPGPETRPSLRAVKTARGVRP